MNDYYIFFKDRFVRQSKARIPVLSASAQFGLNVFEGIRIYKQDAFFVFRLKEHLKRLKNSMQEIGFEIDVVTEQKFIEVVNELIVLNELDQDFSLRITYLVDEIDSWSSVKPPVFFIAPLIKPRNPEKNFYKTAALTETRRISSDAMNVKVKCGANYINGRYALLEAKSKGADLPILCNKDGFISESSGACVFAIKGSTIMTPSLDCDILESITRDTVIQIFSAHDYKVEEKYITESELRSSDEIFLCGSAAEITPIKLLEKSNFRIGELTKFISNEYRLAITNKRYTEYSWTTKVG